MEQKKPWPYPYYHPLSIFRFTHRHFVPLMVTDGLLGFMFGRLLHIQWIGLGIGLGFGIFNFFYLNRTLFKGVM